MAIIDPVCSSDSIWRGTDMTRSVSDDLTAIESNVSSLQTGKSDTTHTHDGYAAADHSHTGYAEVDHTHTGFAQADHTHDGYASSDHTHTGFAAENHSHTGYAAEDHTHDYASSNHTHTPSSIGAAASEHSHSEYASASHSHSGYASSSHSHSEYASASHNHDSDYLPASGDVNVDGVLRVESQQAFYYNTSSSSQTIGTNNATGGTTIACGSSATVGVNGALVKVPTLVPKATGTYYCGNANFRWLGIYSTSAVNVSSDMRLKRDICRLENKSLADFVDKLDVVSYNYNEDAADAKARIGLIAQDVQEADPEISKFFVNTDENGYLNMTPADLVFALIATVQELKQEIDELKNRP